MKHLFFLLTSAVLLFSCDTKDEGDDVNGNNDSERTTENMNKVYKALETGDFKGIDSLFAEDLVDHNGGPMGGDIKGRDSVIANLSQMHNYFDNLKFDVLHSGTSKDGQYHYTTVRMTGKAKQNPWGMPEGMEMDDTSVDVIKLKDGKATDHWAFMSAQDVGEMMQSSQAGNSTQPPAKDTVKRN